MTVRAIARIGLAVVTVLLLTSFVAGVVAAPVLAPLHLWAARDASRPGRIGWAFLAGASVGEWSWATVYVTIGEREPFIWLLPLLAATAAATVVIRVPRG